MRGIFWLSIGGAALIAGCGATGSTVPVEPPKHRVGGVVSGLVGAGLVLQNSGAIDLAVASSGGFSFPALVAEGSPYAVTVKTQPSSPSQICTVSNGTGTVGASNVTSITVSCVTSAGQAHSVGGLVAGLAGTGLVLLNNGTDARAIDGDGRFTFSRSLSEGATYEVTVKKQPASPAQSCTVTGGSGIVGTNDVVTVAVTCRTWNLYFVASNGVSGSQLWRSDGTGAGTGIVVASPSPSGEASSPTSLSTLGDQIFFAAYHSDGSVVYPRSLWKTDGTATGTVLVATAGGFVSGLVDVGGTGYFAGGGSNDLELWRTDGSGAGTVRVADINAGSYGSGPLDLVAVGATVFFTANDGVHGGELWKSDGTAAGTQMVIDLVPGPLDGVVRGWRPVVYRGEVYFLGAGGGSGVELWRTDGTSSGTQLVKDINPGSGAGVWAYVSGVVFEDRIIIAANDGTHGTELWSSDGTAGGTSMVMDVNPGTGDTLPQALTPRGGGLYFRAYEPLHGTELWRTDGTASGTVLVGDVCPGPCSANPTEVTASASELFFVADDGVHGRELWKTDGTAVGTTMVKDIVPGGVGSGPYGLVTVDDTVYFGINDELGGAQLWKSDGTAVGTVMVRQICTGAVCTGLYGLFIH